MVEIRKKFLKKKIKVNKNVLFKARLGRKDT